jgi:peroxiredoxin
MLRFTTRRISAVAAAAAATFGPAATVVAPLCFGALQVGDAIPDSQVFVGTPPRAVSTEATLFKGRKVLLLALPGAFTGNCSKQLPDYARKAAALKVAHGVDEVLCVSTNDTFVNAAWASAAGLRSDAAVTMVADPCRSLLESLGHKVDLGPLLGGERYARVAMVIDDGKIAKLWPEVDGNSLSCTNACQVIEAA